MKLNIAALCFSLFFVFSLSGQENNSTMDFYQFKEKSLDGKEIGMQDYKGKVVLIVNTASKCGFTPQYEGLEKLYSTYKDKGLVILGFPCNQFAGQEPGSADLAEILYIKIWSNFPHVFKDRSKWQGC